MPVGEKHILFVGPNLSFKKEIYQAFVDKEYKVSSAPHGFKAIQIAREEPLDVIVSDLMMYKMGGVKLSQEIHKIGADRQIRCIVICPSEEKKQQSSDRPDGPDVFLVKPVAVADLIRSVEKLVQGRK